MSQGPRTRVRLDGEHYRVVRSSRGTLVYKRTVADGPHAQAWMVLIYNSRNCGEPSPLIARILNAEAEAV